MNIKVSKYLPSIKYIVRLILVSEMGYVREYWGRLARHTTKRFFFCQNMVLWFVMGYVEWAPISQIKIKGILIKL